jgi:pimeloyl-ACP methyl ester carboxylesterase
MPTAICDGIETRYEVTGAGPPLLLFSPGGFNATIENWQSFGIYQRLNLLDRLGEQYTCIAFDRRESGQSGGRVECITWADYAAQAVGLLDHLDVERAYLLGGCIGCSCVAAFAVAHPQRVERMVLYSPAGGPRYRITQRDRFAQHIAYLQQHDLASVVALARADDKSFAQDPRVGPWAPVIRRDEVFAEVYVQRDAAEYAELAANMAQILFDRDTVPGAVPEPLMQLDIPALVIPGNDASHATSAARYLEECLDGSDYWDVPPDQQTEETAPARILAFLQK